jgi:hypothetical protein
VELPETKRGNIQTKKLISLKSKNKNIKDLNRGINEFKKGSQPTTNIVEDENGVLLTYSHNTLNR